MNDMEKRSPTTDGDDDEARFSQVPPDFPRDQYLGSVSGAQDKLTLVSQNGRFYLPGITPAELHHRWETAEDLARQFAEKSMESKAGKRASMSEVEILDQYLVRLIAAKWRPEPEARWVIRRAAQMLGWPIPPAALEA